MPHSDGEGDVQQPLEVPPLTAEVQCKSTGDIGHETLDLEATVETVLDELDVQLVVLWGAHEEGCRTYRCEFGMVYHQL
jgi:hypothetical protein